MRGALLLVLLPTLAAADRLETVISGRVDDNNRSLDAALTAALRDPAHAFMTFESWIASGRRPD